MTGRSDEFFQRDAIAGVMTSTGRWLSGAAGAVLFIAIVGGLIGFVRTADVMLLIMAFAAAGTVLALVAAAHVLLRPDLTGPQRIIWLLIVVFVNPVLPLGAGVYLLLGPERTRALFSDVRFGGGAPPPPPAE